MIPFNSRSPRSPLFALICWVNQGGGSAGFVPPFAVMAPMRNETPPKSIKRALACLRVLPDHPMLLARGSVIARRHTRGLDKVRDLQPKLGDFWVKRPHMPIR